MRAWVPLMAIAAVSCGPPVAPPHPRPMPPPPAATTAAPSATPSVAASAPPAPTPAPTFRLAWQTQTPPFNKGLALTGRGQLAVLASRSLGLRRVQDGKLLGSAQVCFTFPGAFFFVDATSGAVVCEDAVHLYDLPGVKYRGKKPLARKARVAAFGGGLLAVGYASGPASLLDTADWREIAELPADRPVTAMAVAAGGRYLALGFEQGGAVLRDLEQKTARTLGASRPFAVAALSFSPDGKRLFVAAGPWSGVVDTSAAVGEHAFPGVGNVIGARWVSATEVVTVGPDGLLLLDTASGKARSVGGGVTAGELVGIAGDPTNEVVCAASRDGQLLCYSRGKLPASTAVPVPAAEGPSTAGRVIGLVGRRLQVKAHPGSKLPRAGVRVTVRKYVERHERGLVVSSWTEAGAGKVTKLDKDVVWVLLNTTIDPVKQKERELVYDTPIRLSW